MKKTKNLINSFKSWAPPSTILGANMSIWAIKKILWRIICRALHFATSIWAKIISWPKYANPATSNAKSRPKLLISSQETLAPISLKVDSIADFRCKLWIRCKYKISRRSRKKRKKSWIDLIVRDFCLWSSQRILLLDFRKIQLTLLAWTTSIIKRWRKGISPWEVGVRFPPRATAWWVSTFRKIWGLLSRIRK